ncbi:helix-hairpin-helix domain-containing protein [Candidatus Poriferisodalis sp.]|uniref:helix-hairpin-helix domain-containing protein n=1 Tax=Candidatus Poriferisodalis sp. TaxID=3101277 RepID=UPI003D13E0B9
MDWRSIAAEAASFARRIGVAPVAVLVAALVAVVAVTFLAGVRHGAPEPIELPLAASGAPPPVATTQPTSVRVHLAGAVDRPGLYEVPSGYRIGDLLEFAGGPGRDADIAAVNLAEPLRDGQQVYLPTQGEALRVASENMDSAGPLDVNTATSAQLEQLPGIGPSLAAAIFAFRSEHGPFGSLDALTDVPGIGPSKLEQLRAHART